MSPHILMSQSRRQTVLSSPILSHHLCGPAMGAARDGWHAWGNEAPVNGAAHAIWKPSDQHQHGGHEHSARALTNAFYCVGRP